MQDFDAEILAAQDRRRRAQALRAQGIETPQAQMVGGRYIPPSFSDALAQGLRQYGAMKDESSAEQQIKDLSGQRAEAKSSAMANFLRNAQGTDAISLPDDQQGPVQPAQAPNMGGAYAALMQSPDASMQQAGMAGLSRMPELKAAADERAAATQFRKDEADLNRAARAQELQMKMQDQRTSQAEKLQAQREMQQMQIDARREMQQTIAANRPAAQAPQAQTLQTENGMLERVNGKWQPIVIDGKPVMPKGTGTNAALSDVAKVKDANDAMELLKQAAPLVRGATGSGIGAGVDWLAGQVGKATSGAENIAQLKTIAGMLVSKMPKMTGPQSDKDVMLYKEMAGNIGDPSVPTPLKEKAMQTIMEIQARYANTQAPALDFSGAPQKQAGAQDSQAMEWARANPSDPRSKAIMQRLGGQ